MTAAVVTASVAVMVAVLTQLGTWRRSTTERRYARQRAALIDIQDAALDVRRELRRSGQQFGARAAASPRAAGEVDVVVRTATLDDVRGRLEVTAVRVDQRRGGHRVVSTLQLWQIAASEHFLSPADLTTSTEELAWSDFNRSVAGALRAA